MLQTKKYQFWFCTGSQDLLQQRDAMPAPQPKGFRPAINSPYTRHLTRKHLLCLFFCIDSCSIAQIVPLGNSSIDR